MKVRLPNLTWIGLLLAVAYWLIESLIHTFVFGSGTLAETLRGEHDPNEVWMRLLIALLFVGFGAIAQRSVQAERHVKENALRLNRLLRFVDHVKQGVQHPNEGQHALGMDDSAGIGDLALGADAIGTLSRMLRELSSYLDVRFKELYVLLQLTREINMGLLLDEVLEEAYRTLRTVIPYHRLSVALLENDGKVLRARWARSDQPLKLGTGYAGAMAGSSLQGILASGEPRILNDLTLYAKEHPRSDSTRLMVAEGIRSSLTCPLISMGKPIGFLFFSSRDAEVYRDAHVAIFKLIAGHLSVVVEKSGLYQQILREKETSESLLLNVMPMRIAARLRAGEKTIAESLSATNVLFADIANFTELAGRVPAEDAVRVLEEVFVGFDRLCDRYGVEKIKTIGDAYMAISGPPAPAGQDPLRSIAEFALEMLRVAEQVRWPDGQPVSVRIGMHTGPAVAGVIGQKKFAYDIWGDTVNVASRMVATGEPGRVHVTDEVRSRLQEDFTFEFRGETQVKGKGGMKTYYLTARKAL